MAKKRIYRFKGTEGGKISEAEARKWIQTHQDHHETKGHFYGKEVLQKMLDTPGCMGIRIYHGIDDKAGKKLVLIAADAKGNDMWPSAAPKKGKGAEYDGGPIDNAQVCPPWCGK